jgi:hypothetical protein
MKASYTRALALFLAAGLLFMLAGCSGGGSSGNVTVSANNGAVSAQLVWPAGNAAAVKSAVLPATVATVRITITTPDRAPVSGSFPAAAGQGSVAGVPAGSGLTVTAEGLDASNNVIYAGSVSNITVTAGQTTDVTITMSSTGAGTGDVTITGTVAGTSFVAVEASSAAVVARHTAAMQSDGSKLFSIRVQSGRQYKFYLIENEGTSFERVFALYIGNGNRVLVSAGTCNLGFVTTTGDGIAVPTYIPPQFTGSVNDPTVPAGVATSSSSVYTQADLVGTWYVFQLHSGASPSYSYGVGQVDANGNVTRLSSYNSTGSPSNNGTTSVVISTSGIVQSNYSRMVMSRDKNLVVGGSYYAGYSDPPSMTILVRAGSGFVQGDLAGSWKLHSLSAGTDYRNWLRSDMTIDALGNATQNNRVSSNGNPGTSDPFVLNVSSAGVLSATVNGAPFTLHGAITPDKNLIVAANKNRDGSVGLGLLVRTGGVNFSLADMQGSWRYNGLTLDSTGQLYQDDSWSRGLAVIDSNGYSRHYDRVTNGIARPDLLSNSPLLISNAGILLGMTGNGEGIASLSKDLAVITQSSSNNTGHSILTVYMK